MTKARQKIEEIEQDLIDWHYGTVHKQYDREETCEVLEEDTRRYFRKIYKLLTQHADSRLDEFVAEFEDGKVTLPIWHSELVEKLKKFKEGNKPLESINNGI